MISVLAAVRRAACLSAAILGAASASAAQPLPGQSAAPTPNHSASSATRIKDVASLQGAPPLQLIGYGLVIGLAKTGDRKQTLFATQSLANLLQRFGVIVPADQVKIENVAAVLVTTELPSFTPAGGRLDITASSIGDARSLQGGTLLATPLHGPDGSIYATAQGPLSIGGFGGAGKGGSSVTVNHLTVGRVPEGALVNRPHAEGVASSSTIRLTLRDADFVTAGYVSASVNKELGEGASHAIDAATVEVRVPEPLRNEIPALMARLGTLPVEVDTPARIVINERTGTVVVGSGVKLGVAAVAHGNLSVRITSTPNVSQPNAFGGGDTKVTQDEKVDVSENSTQLVTLEEGVTLDAVVRALNTLGASPRDIIAILQSLKAAGALRAEIVII